MLADGSARMGVASLRTDKRGVGDSIAAGFDEAAMTLQTYVEDAALWIDRLRADERFDRLVAIGHSEGAVVLLQAAALRDVDAFVSLAGVGRPPALVLREQLARQVEVGRMPEALRDIALGYVDRLERGEPVEAVEPSLSGLFRPSVQPFLTSTFRFDPPLAARALRAPLLIVQGEADMQVSVADALALCDAQPSSQMLLMKGVNHILKAEPAEPAASLAQRLDPTVPLADGLIEAIAGFIRGTGQRRGRGAPLARLG